MLDLQTDKIECNTKSDFILKVVFRDSRGNSSILPFGDNDFSMIFTSPWTKTQYVACRRGDHFSNCHIHDDTLHVVFKNHCLTGRLSCRIIADIPNSCFESGLQHIEEQYELNVTLRDDINSQFSLTESIEIPIVIKTAYDLAKEQGYTGTQQDYIEAMTLLPQTLSVSRELNRNFKSTTAELKTYVDDAKHFRDDVNNKQAKLETSPTVKVNPDNTLSTTETVEKALFIKMWNKRCTFYGESGADIQYRGRYNPDTDLFELNGLTDITYEQAIDIFTHPVEFNNNMYNFFNTRLRTHLPPYSGRVNQTFLISQATFHGTYMESIRLPGCIADGYWDNGSGSLRILSLSGIKSARVLQFKKNLQQFRWEWYGNVSTSTRPRISLDVSGSPKLDWESYNQLITGQWDGTNTISLKVCSVAYAKIIGDTSVEDVVSMSEEETLKWQSLMAKAEAKNVIITL